MFTQTTQERHFAPLPFLETTLERTTTMEIETVLIGLIILVTIFVLVGMVLSITNSIKAAKAKTPRTTNAIDLPLNVSTNTGEGGNSPSGPLSGTPNHKSEISEQLSNILRTAFSIVAIVLVGLPLLFSFVIDFENPVQMYVVRIVGLTVSVTLLWLYAKVSFFTVEENRLAMLLLFGRYVKYLRPGLVYAPFLAYERVYKIVHMTRNQIEIDLPDDHENIFHGDVNDPKQDYKGIVPDGMTPALRIMFAGKNVSNGKEFLEVKHVELLQSGEKREVDVGKVHRDDVFLRHQAAEVELSYGFRIVDLLTFYRVMGNVDEAIQAMNDNVITGFSNSLHRLTLAEAKLLQREVSDEVRSDIEKFTRGWGILISFARIKPFVFSHNFNIALTGAASAIEEKRATITKSEGAMQDRINQGIAEGKYEEDLGKGRAEALKAITKESQVDGGMTQAIQTIGQAVSSASFGIVDQSNILGSLASATGIIKNFPGSKNSPPTGPQPTSVEAKKTTDMSSETATTALTSTPDPELKRKRRGRRRRNK